MQRSYHDAEQINQHLHIYELMEEYPMSAIYLRTFGIWHCTSMVSLGGNVEEKRYNEVGA
jgi:hypothetical protein